MRVQSAPFQIVRAELYLVQVPLRFSISHALHTRRENTTGFLVLRDDTGRSAAGEFLSRSYVMGGTVDDVIAELSAIVPVVVGRPIDDPRPLLRRLWQNRPVVAGTLSAMCALDLALCGLWSHAANQSLTSLLGDAKAPPSKTIRYSAAYPFAAGLKLQALHFLFRSVMRMSVIKIKGHGALERDAAYVADIRHAYPYPVTIRLDLNGSLSPEKAERYLDGMLANGITWFEQPFAKEDWETAVRWQRQYGCALTLCADESVCTEADLQRAIDSGAFRGVNLRIAKNGGITQALRLDGMARRAGLEVQLGALVGETSLLSYAGLHFAAVVPELRHVEGAFGKLLIKWDPVRPSLTLGRRGELNTGRLPAQGVAPSFDLAATARRAHRHSILGQI